MSDENDFVTKREHDQAIGRIDNKLTAIGSSVEKTNENLEGLTGAIQVIALVFLLFGAAALAANHWSGGDRGGSTMARYLKADK